jgi:CDP-glucose 4,6-dehydratase
VPVVTPETPGPLVALVGLEPRGISAVSRGEGVMKQVLITGATGFVGAHVTEEILSRGANVTALINEFPKGSLFDQRALIQGVNPVVGSLLDYELLEKTIRENKIDTVLHIAAIAIEGAAFQNPRLAFDVNIRGTYNILEACRANSVKKIVVASSDKAYGSHDALPYRETFPLIGKNPYDVSKSCADLIAQAYHHSFGLPIAIGRYGNIFGAGDMNFTRLIPGTLLRLYKGESPLLKFHPDGPFSRDFLFIKDVVGSYISMIEGLDNPKTHGQGFNFALNGNWLVESVVRLLQKVTDTESIPLDIVPANHGEIKDQHVSNEKAREMLNWSPKYKLEEALAETAKWYYWQFQLQGIEQANRPVAQQSHG